MSAGLKILETMVIWENFHEEFAICRHAGPSLPVRATSATPAIYNRWRGRNAVSGRSFMVRPEAISNLLMFLRPEANGDWGNPDCFETDHTLEEVLCLHRAGHF